MLRPGQKNFLAGILAEVRNRQVNHKVFPFESDIAWSDHSTRFEAISKPRCGLPPHPLSGRLPLARHSTQGTSIYSTKVNCCSDKNFSEILGAINEALSLASPPTPLAKVSKCGFPARLTRAGAPLFEHPGLHSKADPS